MSVLVNGLPGWFRRRRENNGETEATSGTTTGGDLDQEPVVIWRAPNQMEAEVVKGRLESEGIPAIIRGEALGAIYGLTSGTLAETSVLVPAALAEKAETILYAGGDDETSAPDSSDDEESN